MIDISVIIPVYNAGKDLYRCVDSILDAQIPELETEIILVNDGSTDDSLQVCLEYADKHENIHVHSQKNKGLPGARNSGLKIATGKYISFVDNDDTLEPNYFQALLKPIKENHDVIEFGYNRVENNIKKIIPTHKNSLNRTELINEVIHSTKNKMLWFVWRRLYKNEFLKTNHICFDEEITHGEDSQFSLEIFRILKNLKTIPENIYNYFETENSITKTKYRAELLKKFEVQYSKRSLIRFDDVDNQLLLRDLAKNYIDHTLLSIFGNIKNSPENNKKEELKNTRESIIYKETFKDYKYDWSHPKKSLLIKLFELKLYNLILKLI